MLLADTANDVGLFTLCSVMMGVYGATFLAIRSIREQCHTWARKTREESAKRCDKVQGLDSDGDRWLSILICRAASGLARYALQGWYFALSLPLLMFVFGTFGLALYLSYQDAPAAITCAWGSYRPWLLWYTIINGSCVVIAGISAALIALGGYVTRVIFDKDTRNTAEKGISKKESPQEG
jgi:hypothetical protein